MVQEKMVNVCRAIRDQKEDQSNSAVKKAMLYIQENYSRDISLDDVSSQVNISPYYFSKIFKEETGENFIEYLTRVRIDKAKELLVDANVSVKEAGIQSGYSDPNYFSRIFKKQMSIKRGMENEKVSLADLVVGFAPGSCIGSRLRK